MVLSVRRSYRGLARADTVGVWRRHVRDWLTDTTAISTERVCDVTLACSEALANSAEHAYRNCDDVDSMTLDLDYDPATMTIEIVIGDQGQWMPPEPDSCNEFRGRGLPLIRMLSDACKIDGGRQGTTVRLTFCDCPPAR